MRTKLMKLLAALIVVAGSGAVLSAPASATPHTTAGPATSSTHQPGTAKPADWWV